MEGALRNWRPSSRVVAVGSALFLAGIIFSEALRTAFFLFFIAFLLAVLLDYPVRLLARILPRGLAAALVLVTLLAGMFAAVSLAVPPLLDQGSKVVEDAPRAVEKIEGWWNRVRNKAQVDAVPTGGEIQRDVRKDLGKNLGGGSVASLALPIAFNALSAISTVALLLVLATFMVAHPKAYADGVVWLVPRESEDTAREFLSRLVLTIRGWMSAQLISMTIVGGLTAVGLFFIGVKGWAVLGLVNFFCEFVPFLGPIVGAAPGIAVAVADSSQKGIYAAVLYFAVQQLEGYLVSPLVMRHEVRLAPPVLLLWQVLMGAAFGILGVVVATPLLACVKVSVDYFWVERTLGKKTEPLPG